jgi:hypothetical protein
LASFEETEIRRGEGARTHHEADRAVARLVVVVVLGVEVLQLGVRVDGRGGAAVRARGVVDTGELSGSRLRLVVDLGVVHLLADAKHHAELALSGLGVGVRAGLPLGAAALGEHALARAARAARAGGRRGRAKRRPELRKTQAAHHLRVRGDARGAQALVRRQPLHARAREE